MSKVISRLRPGDTRQEVSALCIGTDYFRSGTPAKVAWRLLDDFTAAVGTFLDKVSRPGREQRCATDPSLGGEAQPGGLVRDTDLTRSNPPVLFPVDQPAPDGWR